MIKVKLQKITSLLEDRKYPVGFWIQGYARTIPIGCKDLTKIDKICLHINPNTSHGKGIRLPQGLSVGDVATVAHGLVTTKDGVYVLSII